MYDISLLLMFFLTSYSLALLTLIQQINANANLKKKTAEYWMNINGRLLLFRTVVEKIWKLHLLSQFRHELHYSRHNFGQISLKINWKFQKILILSLSEWLIVLGGKYFPSQQGHNWWWICKKCSRTGKSQFRIHEVRKFNIHYHWQI